MVDLKQFEQFRFKTLPKTSPLYQVCKRTETSCAKLLHRRQNQLEGFVCHQNPVLQILNQHKRHNRWFRAVGDHIRSGHKAIDLAQPTWAWKGAMTLALPFPWARRSLTQVALKHTLQISICLCNILMSSYVTFILKWASSKPLKRDTVYLII